MITLCSSLNVQNVRFIIEVQSETVSLNYALSNLLSQFPNIAYILNKKDISAAGKFNTIAV